MKKILNKWKDFNDTTVRMVVLLGDDNKKLATLIKLIDKLDRTRFNYKLTEISTNNFVMELKMPYNRYLALQINLLSKGLSFNSITDVEIFHEIIEIEITDEIKKIIKKCKEV